MFGLKNTFGDCDKFIPAPVATSSVSVSETHVTHAEGTTTNFQHIQLMSILMIDIRKTVPRH